MSAYLVDHETYQPGSVIIEEGSKGDWVYIVLEGAGQSHQKDLRGDADH